jgi:CspA family cold shock protein
LASLQINQSTISVIAERIVQARRLYGTDSSYVIGLFQGLDMLFEGTELTALRQQIKEQVVKLEGTTSAASGPTSGSAKPPTQDKQRTPGQDTGDTESDTALEENSWVRGAVKWFNNDKGYGFISTSADADVFVHWRDISSWDRSLTQGDEVEFMVTKTAKGFQAINVMKPGAGETQTAATAGEAETEAIQPTPGDNHTMAQNPAPGVPPETVSQESAGIEPDEIVQIPSDTPTGDRTPPLGDEENSSGPSESSTA